MKKDIKILAIESSCDETAAAVILGCHPEQSEGSICKDSSSATQNDNLGFPVILSNIVSSQIDLHAKTGGVVPEVASRAHMEAILPVVAEAIIQAKISNSEFLTRLPDGQVSNKIPNDKLKNDQINGKWKMENGQYSEAIELLQKEIDFVAVTAGPGLVGSLLVGFNAAKSLAYALDKPIIPVNHIEGHIYSAFSGIENPKSLPEVASQHAMQAGEYQTLPTGRQVPNQSQNSNSKKEEILRLPLVAQDDTSCQFPILALTVSGGHTSLTLMHDHGSYKNLGQTLDDAAGEAFDKVAKLLDLGYPGGPIVSKLASQFRNKSEILNPKLETNSKLETRNSKQKNNNLTIQQSNPPKGDLPLGDNYQLRFPRPILNDGTFNFSFSGLKTAVLQHVIELKRENFLACHPEAQPKDLEILRFAQNDKKNNQDGSLSLEQKQEICAAFEDAVVDVLTTKTMRAVLEYNPKSLILAGGVAANKQLRTILLTKVDEYNNHLFDVSNNSRLNLLIPPINLCGDNAAMIGLAAFFHIQKNNISSWDKVKVDSNLEL